MSTGLPSIILRFAPVPLRRTTDTAGKISSPLVRRPILAFVAGIFFAAVLATQAQESIEPDVLPSLAEPPAASAEAPTSVSTEPLPALPQSLPYTAAEPVPSAAEPVPSAAEPVPSAAEPLPSSEQAFPSSLEPLSPSTNYTTPQTPALPPPVSTAPYGGGGSKNIFPAGETISSGEPRRFHYELRLTVRGR